jgi:serine/threonine protein kinase/TolA-binding protein
MDGFPRRFGGYVLAKPLARGGMGALYLALHGPRGMEKLCVVKTALPHLAGKSYVQRFKDEAKVVVRLSHGNLVGVFDTGQVKGEIYLAMEFVEGKDLRAVWNRCAQKGIAFPLPVAVQIAKELVRGLSYAHTFEGLNLVHRDVSPPNVLLSYSGEVKLTDFGLATSTLKLEKTAPGVIYGKVSYMAPEQARSEPLDGRTDLYAAGVILWELLTGRQLFSAGPRPPGQPNQDDLLERVRRPQIVPPSQRAVRVPAELDAIVMKALAVNPAERYQDGEEFLSDLAGFLAKTAPAMDNHQVAHFLRELFGDTIAKEREERHALLATAVNLLDAPSTSHQGMVSGPADSVSDRERASTAPLGRPSEPASQASRTEEGSLMVGALLAGRYSIRRLCGEGGMGRVYEAEHIEIGKRVAVKVLHPAYSRTPDLVERFRREARAASRIENPNVVSVTDFGTTDDGSLFFVMEYIEGIELGLLIHREGPLPVNRMLRIAEQMSAALQAAHLAGVIHRDLKPENILLVSSRRSTPEGSEVVHDFPHPDMVKVLDFGIAKSAEMEENSRKGKRLTRPGVAMGTPEYMAPEQAAGYPADPRSDIYSVGSIMYEMLTGSPPYDGENVMEVLHKKANQPPRPLLEIRPDVSPVVATFIEKVMARNPDHRPQSMAELARGIHEIEQQLAMTPSPVVVPEARKESLAGVDAVGGTAPARSLPSRRVLALGGIVVVAALALLVVRGARRTSGTTPVPSTPVVTVSTTAPLPTSAVEAGLPESPADASTDTMPAITEAPVESTVDEPAPEEPSRKPPRVRPARPAPAVAGLSTNASRQILEEGRDFLRAQRYDEASAAFKRLIQPGSKTRGPAEVGLAKIAFQKKDYQEAANHAREGARFGGGVEARVVLGDAYFRLEKFEDARKAYTEALKLDPDNRTAKQNLSLIEHRGN